MDSDEQRLRDEVIYLHSLWHQGPPRNPNPNPNPTPISKSSRILHQTSISTTFKNTTTTSTTTTRKQKTKPKKLKKVKKAKKAPESDSQPPASGAEWPVQPISEKPSGWSKSPSLPTTRPATAEEESKLVALQMQEKGLAACREFFSRNVSDDDSDDADDDDDDDLEEDGCEEFEFFVGLFTKDAELRSYYEKNNGGGVFCCLVCGGMGKKVGRRYKDCVGLVQHSIAISRTNKKRAHRAYGQVICRVLGWDVNRLPTIVLKGNSSGNTDNLDSTYDNLNAVIKDQNVDMDEVKGDSGNNADNLNVVVEDSHTNGVELKDSLEEGNDGKLEDLAKGVSDTADVNTGELDCPVPVKKDGVEPESKDSQEAIIVSGGANCGTSGGDLQQ